MQSYSKHCEVGISPLDLVVRSRRSRRPGGKSATPIRSAKQLREREIDELVARYREIRSMREVAREFRMSRTTVAKHLADRGIDASRGMKALEINKAVSLYIKGLSSMTIGKQLGYDNHTIIKALREQGVPIRVALGR
ncbi:hypothetical protein [Glaciibacter psychrotolerans]|uniref:DNA-binding CsgD family transcriptional regulator n=1 Tax=Glaciibacter psychrotolerans TaxID=670054 RepID=A0A7Z0J4X6_9MICO|nr:hypothetical protein [Leifsonia psychrotolerans]NYJ18293.1 DNA-binding CsgD family transcriptional regulator [Leifsonia psychrotolerans]